MLLITTELKSQDNGFILDFWERVFGLLSQISVFYWVRKIIKKTSYTFIECWVMGNFIAAIFCSIFVYYLSKTNKIVLYIVFAYAVIRTFEIIVYQLNVLLFDSYRAFKRGEKYKIKSVNRMVVLLLQNYIEIIFWYSTMMIVLIILSNGIATMPFSEYIRSTVLCIVTLDREPVINIVNNNYSIFADLAFAEIISGIIMTLLSIARFIGSLPGTETVDTF